MKGGGDEGGTSGGGGGRERPCDSCRSPTRAVYCPADAAYLCAGCDALLHAANPVASRHERVWVLGACQRSPAALLANPFAACLHCRGGVPVLERHLAPASHQMTASSVSHSISPSFIDANVMGDINTVIPSSCEQMPVQFTPTDREARVLRYREKRKTRKFEKMIRYASRKAYAETRPRINGRFARARSR